MSLLTYIIKQDAGKTVLRHAITLFYGSRMAYMLRMQSDLRKNLELIFLIHKEGYLERSMQESLTKRLTRKECSWNRRNLHGLKRMRLEMCLKQMSLRKLSLTV